MVELSLEPLALGDAPALFVFERKNRLWFEKHVGPRPDTYNKLTTLTEVVDAQVHAGELMFLLKKAGMIIGRVNLTNVDAGVAQLGYRLGEEDCGQGHASHAVGLALQVARDRGLWALEARVALTNPASKRVLEKNGFHLTGARVVDGIRCETFHRPLD